MLPLLRDISTDRRCAIDCVINVITVRSTCRYVTRKPCARLMSSGNDRPIHEGLYNRLQTSHIGMGRLYNRLRTSQQEQDIFTIRYKNIFNDGYSTAEK